MVIQNIITLPDKSDKAIILQTPPINCDISHTQR